MRHMFAGTRAFNHSLEDMVAYATSPFRRPPNHSWKLLPRRMRGL